MQRARSLWMAPSSAVALVLVVAVSGCKPDSANGAEPSSSAAPAAATTEKGGPLLGPRAEAASGEDWNASQIEWLSFEAGSRRAKEQQRPILLVFWAGWCSHCKVYSHVFEDPRVVELARRFVMVRANVDEEEALAQRYAPDGGYVPRTLFLSSEGVLQREIHAARPQYVHFYDERNPASLLGGMKAALAKLGQ